MSITLRTADVVCKPYVENSFRAKIFVEPLTRGYGSTIGNSLRRVLLSSIKGSSITHVGIAGVYHEFSSIHGVVEDVVYILLNLKKVRIKRTTLARQVINVTLNGPMVFAAGILEKYGDFSIVNKDLVICDIVGDVSVSFVIVIESGVGYVDGANHSPIPDHRITFGRLIPIDSIFSPVVKVGVFVEECGMIRGAAYDKLIMDVETDGALSPEEAVFAAAKILERQFKAFSVFDEEETVVDDIVSEQEFSRALLRPIEELELSVRAQNCLRNEGVLFVADLVQKSEQGLLETPNLGRKSITEIKDKLANANLRLDMRLDNWPPDNLKELLDNIEGEY